MKPPKSAGKRVRWAVRYVGQEDLTSGSYADRSVIEKIKRSWERNNEGWNYELVKITTEPVETKKRKAK